MERRRRGRWRNQAYGLVAPVHWFVYISRFVLLSCIWAWAYLGCRLSGVVVRLLAFVVYGCTFCTYVFALLVVTTVDAAAVSYHNTLEEEGEGRRGNNVC